MKTINIKEFISDNMGREEDLDHLYRLMDKLEQRLGGKCFLKNCDGKMGWPQRGIYFYFENGDLRENGEMRIVRVGTHALKQYSKSTLWGRLRQHKGTEKGKHAGGGNHRGSIFRLHVGTAIQNRDNQHIQTWGVGQTAKGEIRDNEYPVEKLVSEHIRSMPFLWIEINDLPGPESLRGYIERNSIGLLSNLGKSIVIDPPSPNWLGRYADRDKVRLSGLWNVNHVDDTYEQSFLDVLSGLVEEM